LAPEGDAYRILMGILEGRRPLGKPRYRCEGNIEMDLLEPGWREGYRLD
jgi:hypothetical protein